MPNLSLEPETTMEVVESCHTTKQPKIRRLKQLGANNEEMIDVYFKQVISILEIFGPLD